MKFATIKLNDTVHPIIAVDEKKPKFLNDILNILNLPKYESLQNFIQKTNRDISLWQKIQAKVSSAPNIKTDGCKWLPPIQRPNKILGVAFNNKELMKKAHKDPGVPNFFLKPSSCLIGHQEKIIVDPSWGSTIPEPEICAIIGKGGKNITETAALDHIFGYSIFNDVTSHGLKFGKDSIAVTYDQDMARDEFYNWRHLKDHEDRDVFYVYHTRSKGTDTFGPLGPWIKLGTSISNPNQIGIKAYLNEKLFTEDTTANYRFSIEKCVAEASKYFTLETNDIISFGTTGKGNINFPRGHKSVLLGEVKGEITIQVEQIGILRNTIVHQKRGD